jgi:hypothetical protein
MNQDFEESLKVTHASYILHSDAFIEGGYTENKLKNAQRGHVLLGYNFVVTRISAVATDSAAGVIDVEVSVEQTGVAPFYYPLSIALNCPELPSPLKVGGLEGLIDQGISTTFTVRDVPSTWRCLQDISISLDSPMLLPGRKMKFSQGNGSVNVKIPMPSRMLDAVFDADQPEDAEVFVMRQPSADHAGNRGAPERQLPLAIDIEEDTVKVAFFYLTSQRNEIEHWVPLVSGDVVEIPRFGLSIAVRPDKAVSSIWFSYGTGEMHIDNVPPYRLSSNNYLVSSGVKELVATAFVDGRISTVTKLTFEVVAPRGGITVKNHPSSAVAEKRSIGANGPKTTKHETKAIGYDAHGFNTPFAPSLLQLVSLDRMSASVTGTGADSVSDNAVEVTEISSADESGAAGLRMTLAFEMMVLVWCLIYLLV